MTQRTTGRACRGILASLSLKDIRREFLTGPRKFDEIMEGLEIIVNEMMADDGPEPMDLGNVGMHDGKASQNDSDASNDMSHEEVCAIAWQGSRLETTDRVGDMASWKRS